MTGTRRSAEARRLLGLRRVPHFVMAHAQETEMGGPPSKGTKADKRLATNKPKPKK